MKDVLDVWLVAHDFSPCSDAALFRAGQLARGGVARLVLLHVHPDLHVKREYTTGAETFREEEQLRRRLDEAAAAVIDRFPEVAVEACAAQGAALETILEEAERLDASLIVVGTHGRTGVSHFILGSVAEALVQKSPRSVLVVKGRP